MTAYLEVNYRDDGANSSSYCETENLTKGNSQNLLVRRIKLGIRKIS